MKAFKYELEPLRERARWQLEAARLKLAQIEKSIAQERGQLEQVMQTLAQVAQSEQFEPGARIDLPRQRQVIGHLTALRARITERRRALAGLEEAALRQRAECLARHQRLETTEQHRKFQSDAHQHLEVVKEIRQADESWLVRAQWLEGSPEQNTDTGS